MPNYSIRKEPTDDVLVAEVIALNLRQPNAHRQYLHPQIFSGVSYIIGTIFMIELRRTAVKPKKDVEEGEKEEESS